MDDASQPAADPWPSLPWPGRAELCAEIRRFAASSAWDEAAVGRLLGEDAAGARGAGPAPFPAIVTGQQPAVGGGPLYTLVKVAHAIAIAEALGCDRPATPVFWCASEDHDLGEAGHADLVTRQGQIRRFSADLGGGRAALRHRPAAAWWDGLVGHCREHLGPGLGADWLQAQRPQGDEGLGAWLCRLLGALFAHAPTARALRCVEGHRLRPLWRAALARALERWPAAELAAQRRRLLAAGQADAFGELGQPPLFADRPEGRAAVDPGQARLLLASEPDRLSPGAALRPVLQQVALQAPIYVAGPGELRYHAFIAPLYAALGAPRPRLALRCSLTLVPAWAQRGLAAWGRSAADSGGSAPDAPPATAADDELAAIDAAIAALARRADGAAAPLRRRLATGVARLGRERDRLGASLARGERLAAQRPAWGALAGFLHPRGQRQERTMSLFQALWEHGPGLARVLVEAARACAPGEHRYVELG